MSLLCRSCSGKLVYHPYSDKLCCSYCGGSYGVDESLQDDLKSELIINSCSTCGAKITFYGSEITSSCPFCGNNEMSVRRVTGGKRPDYIIPFRFGKQRADELAREHLKHLPYQSGLARKMKFTRILGIYVPYYIVNAEYKNVLDLVKYRYDENGNVIGEDHLFRSAECLFDKLEVEASSMLLDDASSMIAPFDLDALRPFNDAYLQGFSADMADEDGYPLYRRAREDCLRSAGEEIRRRAIPQGFEVCAKDERIMFGGGSSYALFPVWFVTGTHGGRNVTLLINGQTGKAFGGPDHSEGKFRSAIFLTSLITVPLMTAAGLLLGAAVTVLTYETYILGLLLLLLAAAGFFALAFISRKKFRIAEDYESVSGSTRLIKFMDRRNNDD